MTCSGESGLIPGTTGLKSRRRAEEDQISIPESPSHAMNVQTEHLISSRDSGEQEDPQPSLRCSSEVETQ